MNSTTYRARNDRKIIIYPASDTYLFLGNGDKFPKSLEYANKCIMIVEWWLHIHGCTIDDFMDRLGLQK
jgi:hypothetical protein